MPGEKKEEKTELQKTTEELEALAKSGEAKKDEPSPIDDLLKAIEEGREVAEGLEALAKSERDEDEEDEEDEKEKKEKKEGMEKAETQEYEEELVKASEAYASLEMSVTEALGEIRAAVATLAKSIQGLHSLQMVSGRALAGFAKSTTERFESLGAKPTGRSKTELGLGEEKESLQKSRTEIRADLLKAAREKKVEWDALSRFDIGGIDRLTQSERGVVGL